jgi:hypothetical protein
MSSPPDWIEYVPALQDEHAEEPAAMIMMLNLEWISNPRKLSHSKHKALSNEIERMAFFTQNT